VPPTVTSISPSSTKKASSSRSCTCGGGLPSAVIHCSRRVKAPFVCSAVARSTINELSIHSAFGVVVVMGVLL